MTNSEKKIVAYIPGDDQREDGYYRVALVVEGEDGFHWTGNVRAQDYTGKGGQVLPWYWGPTYDDALKTAEQYNKSHGISKKVAERIVRDSIVAGMRKR